MIVQRDGVEDSLRAKCLRAMVSARRATICACAFVMIMKMLAGTASAAALQQTPAATATLPPPPTPPVTCTTGDCSGLAETSFSVQNCAPIPMSDATLSVINPAEVINPFLFEGAQIIGTRFSAYLDTYNVQSSAESQRIGIELSLADGAKGAAGVFVDKPSKTDTVFGNFRTELRAYLYISGASFYSIDNEPLIVEDDEFTDTLDVTVRVNPYHACRIESGDIPGLQSYIDWQVLAVGNRGSPATRSTRVPVPYDMYRPIRSASHGTVLNSGVAEKLYDDFINVEFLPNEYIHFSCSLPLYHCAPPTQGEYSSGNINVWNALDVPHEETGGFDVYDLGVPNTVRGHLNDGTVPVFGVCKSPVSGSPCCQACSMDAQDDWATTGNPRSNTFPGKSYPLRYYLALADAPQGPASWATEIVAAFDSWNAILRDFNVARAYPAFARTSIRDNADIIVEPMHGARYSAKRTKEDSVAEMHRLLAGSSYSSVPECDDGGYVRQYVEWHMIIDVHAADTWIGGTERKNIWRRSDSPCDWLSFYYELQRPIKPLIAHEIGHIWLEDKYATVGDCASIPGQPLMCAIPEPAHPTLQELCAIPLLPVGGEVPKVVDNAYQPRIQEEIPVLRCIHHRMDRANQ